MRNLLSFILLTVFALPLLAQIEDKEVYGYLYCHMSRRGEWTTYALSRDGINYHDLNGGEAVYNTAKLSAIEGGARDAYIARSADGNGFVMVTTDMCNAKSKKWSNYGINLLKSDDLINWTSVTFDFRKGAAIFCDPESPDVYQDYSAIRRVWAPQFIWDAEYQWADGSKGGYMVYYSLLNSKEDKYDRVFYSYADRSFAKLTKPRLLIDWGYATIDADINYLPSDGKFHLLIKKEGGTRGIFKSVADKVTGPYSQPDEKKYISFEGNKQCEGASAFRLAGDSTWRVGYVEYSSHPTRYVICKADKYLNNFHSPEEIKGVADPQHGSFLPLTKKEYQRLEKWSEERKKENVKIETLTPDGAWCWFADPRAIYHKGKKEQTYFSWITTEGDIVVASYNHKTKEFQQKVLWEKWQSDDHDNPTLLIRNDGRLIVFFSKHFGPPIKRFISTNPEDITSWGEEYELGTNVTYPYPFRIGKTIYVFYRGGESWKPHMVVSTDNGETFGEPVEIITSTGHRPYTRYCQGKDGSIHMAVTTGHPRNERENKIYYCRFKDNKFYRADGSLIKDLAQGALHVREMDMVYDGKSSGKGWIWDIALEKKTEYPVLVFASFPTDKEHLYHYARWDGSTWNTRKITEAGRWFPQTPIGKGEPEPNYSGGIILDYDNPNTVYLSKQVDGVFEIFKYTTKNHGVTWKTKAVTKDTPSHLVNVRPIVPRHHKKGCFDVIWMRGEYEFYANRRYKTSLVYIRK